MRFAAALTVLGSVELNFHYLQTMLGEYYGASFIVISAIVALLRWVTNLPIAER